MIIYTMKAKIIQIYVTTITVNSLFYNDGSFFVLYANVSKQLKKKHCKFHEFYLWLPNEVIRR